MDALGRNLIAELTGCPPELLNDVMLIEGKLVAAVRAARATVVSVSFHHFAPFGVSGVVVIQESHVAIHTWPEYGYAALDIFTCGQDTDPWEIYRAVCAELRAQHFSAVELGRGQRQSLVPHALPGAGLRSGPPPLATSRSIWFTEQQSAIAVSLRHAGQPLLRQRSAHQLIEIYETTACGRMLVLDGIAVATEYDEFIYHEMAVHPAALTHLAPRRALVLGGGDGGVARELLRHPEIEEIVVAERDEAVIGACRELLPAMGAGLSDPRVRVQIADGASYLTGCVPESFDLVILDVPFAPADSPGGLWESLFRAARSALRAGGVLVAQGGSPHSDAQGLQALHKGACRVFGSAEVSPYLIAVPTYPSGLWCLLHCRRGGAHPVRALDERRAAELCARHPLRCFSAAVHAAAFALPAYVRELLQASDPERSAFPSAAR
jgi:spermidine synthase